MRFSTTISMSIATLAVCSIASCVDSPSEVSHEGLHDAAQIRAMESRASGLSSETAALVKAVHASTARYHSKVQATKAGHELASPCVAAPGLGGMGFHWVKFLNVNEVFNPLEPEALLYDTKGKLVAVEYIVVNIGQTAPTFGDQPFDVGGAPISAPHWTLHVWLHKDNPSGIFTPFNPAVTCPS